MRKLSKKILSLYAKKAIIGLASVAMVATMSLSTINVSPVKGATTSSTLVWSDEFNGNSIDASKWGFEIGTGSNGWGNNEQQYYTNRTDNAYVADGALHIRAKKEAYGGKNYTSARLNTNGKFTFTYGYVEARLALPSSQGIWPAFWMLGANYATDVWPKCGEIDIMEQLNHDGIVYQTIHSHYKNDLGFTKPVPTKTVSYNKGQFNIFGIEWTPEALTFKVNGATTLVYPNLHLADESVKKQWPFDTSFYLILNYALGGPGTWPGTITDSELPAKMEIDWVKVSQPTGR